MAYSGLISFIKKLEENNEIQRIKTFVDPELEITEITDRITKSGRGKALLFENNGTSFPVLINAFGSDERMAMALGVENSRDAMKELENLFDFATITGGNFFKKLSSVSQMVKMGKILPEHKNSRGSCQEVIHPEPDLGILPVLKCWPHDGGRFITLPMVHTRHPETGKTNVGMYRMQIIDSNTTGMHWQRHKTGANHFEAWKKSGKKMPVSVALGGDPVYTYAATAPLPENIDEYILAGFLRKKKVKLVRCITNDLYIPADADIVIEGFVDPGEDLFMEGPFGDHTGFYSLADLYPKFHVTCITHSKNAIYPATIVGIPPQEDAWFAKTTETIFLSPIKLALQPEITDLHMPDAGTAHNLLVVKIDKNYPGQGMKVISSLSGAGQLMFTKYVVVVSGNVDIRNYKDLLHHIFDNADLTKDLFFYKGPLDVLDHTSDNFSYGGKAGLDATVKHNEEHSSQKSTVKQEIVSFHELLHSLSEAKYIQNYNINLLSEKIPVLIIAVNPSEDEDALEKAKDLLRRNITGMLKFVLAVDHSVDINDLFMIAWQALGNSDPYRDHEFISSDCIFIDGTIKAYRKGGFTRKWPNIVCSKDETITAIDNKWEVLELGPFINSPSLKFIALLRKGEHEILL